MYFNAFSGGANQTLNGKLKAKALDFSYHM
jgi:hypothetical protein